MSPTDLAGPRRRRRRFAPLARPAGGPDRRTHDHRPHGRSGSRAVIWTSRTNPSFGLDYRWHVAAAQRLLDTGTPYLPWQLTGPYVIGNGAILYPPTAFLLFIPFIWLPAVLWWAVPIAIRPGRCGGTARRCGRGSSSRCCSPSTSRSTSTCSGTRRCGSSRPSRAGTVWRWPFVFVFAKPTFAPIAFLGIRHRSWWVALGDPRGRVAAVPARLVRLAHGRDELGRLGALQPADPAADADPAGRLGRGSPSPCLDRWAGLEPQAGSGSGRGAGPGSLTAASSTGGEARSQSVTSVIASIAIDPTTVIGPV